MKFKAWRVSLAGRKNAWVAGRGPCRATWGAGRAPKVSHFKPTTFMSKTTTQPTAAGNANVSRTLTKTTRTTVGEALVCHIGLDVHAANFTAAIAGPGCGEVRELVMSRPSRLHHLDSRLANRHPRFSIICRCVARSGDYAISPPTAVCKFPRTWLGGQRT